MSTYAWRAITTTGSVRRGSLEAESRQAVVERLRSRGLAGVRVRARPAMPEALRVTRVRRRDVMQQLQSLAEMRKADLAIAPGLRALAGDSPNASLERIWNDVAHQVEIGTRLPVALARHPEAFSPVVIGVVEAGDEHGRGGEALVTAAEHMSHEMDLLRRARSAFVMPVLLIAISVVVMLAGATWLPHYVSSFSVALDPSQRELPAITRAALTVSHAITGYWWAGTIALAVAVVSVRLWLRTPAGRLRWDTAKLHLPLGVGRTIRKFALARWARTLAELHSAGVPERRSLTVAANAAGNAAIREASKRVQRRLQVGTKLSQALAEHPVFGHEVVAMVRTAEDSSAVKEMLGHIAELYDKESEAAVDTMIPTFQFAMYGVAAGAIMLTALVMYIPMIEMIGRLAKTH